MRLPEPVAFKHFFSCRQPLEGSDVPPFTEVWLALKEKEKKAKAKAGANDEEKRDDKPTCRLMEPMSVVEKQLRRDEVNLKSFV